MPYVSKKVYEQLCSKRKGSKSPKRRSKSPKKSPWTKFLKKEAKKSENKGLSASELAKKVSPDYRQKRGLQSEPAESDPAFFGIF